VVCGGEVHACLNKNLSSKTRIGKMKQSSYEYNNERSSEETSQGPEGV
jgi:hypothetical protein